VTLKVPRKPLKCFESESRGKKFISRIDRGIQTVRIDKIIGSVSRCLDFDNNFSVKNIGNRQHILSKVESIKQTLQEGKPVPAVYLYKMDDEYYVVDGHHRIAAAKEAGQKFIDAHIIEYLPPGNTRKGLLTRKRIEFEFETGLGDIELSQRYDYDKLLFQIKEHKKNMEKCLGKKMPLKEAARDWFQSVFYPVCEKIKKANLKEYFPNATVGDIYVYLCDQINIRNKRGGNYAAGVEETLKELGILTKATRLIFSEESFKEKLLRLLSPCFYLKRCPFDGELESCRYNL